MPIYEYQCQKCGGTFEYQQRMADAPKTVCETCGGPLERLISRTAFSLKGGGWYKDLYSSPKPGGDSKGGSGESKPAGEGKPAAGEGKPAGGESKPAADSKPAAESKPAADSKPAGGKKGDA